MDSTSSYTATPFADIWNTTMTSQYGSTESQIFDDRDNNNSWGFSNTTSSPDASPHSTVAVRRWYITKFGALRSVFVALWFYPYIQWLDLRRRFRRARLNYWGDLANLSRIADYVFVITKPCRQQTLPCLVKWYSHSGCGLCIHGSILDLLLVLQ